MKAQRALPKRFIIAGIVLVTVLLGLLFLANALRKSAPHRAASSPSPSATSGESAYDPKNDTEAGQRATPSPTTSATPVSATPTSAPGNTLKPIITGVDGSETTAASQISVDALPGSATSGTCTLTVKQSGATVTTTSTIGLVSSYYACGTMKIDKSKLVSGDAAVEVSVMSPSGSGTSDSRTVMVAK